jgi:hypothetical protein
VFAFLEDYRDLQYEFDSKLQEVFDANLPLNKDKLDELLNGINEKLAQDPELVSVLAIFLALDRVSENRVYYHVDTRYMNANGRSPMSGLRITSAKNLEEETEFPLNNSRNFL